MMFPITHNSLFLPMFIIRQLVSTAGIGHPQVIVLETNACGN